MVTIGIDVGTTSVKAVAFDQSGRRVGSAQADYPLLHPKPGWYELDPQQVVGAAREVIAKAAALAGAGRVGAVACSALGEAVVPVDAGGRPLYNSIVAIDHRATGQAETLRGRIDPADFFGLTGQSLHPIASICKILWWRDHEPEVFRSAASFLCWNEMLGLALGLPLAETGISPSLAARTGLLELATGAWAERLMGLVGLGPGRLARVVPAGEALGQVGRQQAEALGLARGCLYVSGGWDQVCAALGSGAVDPGTVVNSMGSTDSLNATYRGANTSAAMLRSHLTCNPHVLPGHFCTNAFSTTGGNLLSWFRERLDSERAERMGAGEYFDLLTAEALEARNPVLVLPHFAGSGTPAMDPEARGALVGLSLATDRRDIAMGILEGVALEMALNLQALREAGIPVQRLFASGGGTRNPRLLQLRADVYGEPVSPLEVEEAGCLACGLLARKALEPAADLAALARAAARPGVPVEPRPQQAARYREKLTLYRELYPALKSLSARLRDFQEA